MSPQEESTPIKIERQGAIVLDAHGAPTALVQERSENLLLLNFDADSKYGKVAFAYSDPPGLSLEAVKETLYCAKGLDREAHTKIVFPELEGWDVVLAARSGRHCFSVCLRRIRSED